MRIARILVHQVDLPLPGAGYRLSGGRRFTRFDSTVVRLHTDDGHEGVAETCPFGASYMAAHGPGARAAIGALAPCLLGADPRRVDRVNERMDAGLPGHEYAKAAIDVACWDLFGQATGLPVCELLGGGTDAPMGLISSIGWASADAMRAEVDAFRADGYHGHSIKVGDGVDTDAERIRAVLDERRPGELVVVDVNRGWTPDTALRVLRRLPADADFYLEQPCATRAECLALRRRVDVPLMWDELVVTEADLLELVAAGGADAINLKVSRVGGLTKARRIRDLCHAAGLPVTVQDTAGSDIAFAAIAHLGQTVAPARLLDVWDCRRLVTVTTANGGPAIEAGRVRAPDEPGLGVRVVEDNLGPPVGVYA